jgi:hypothetical protein
MKSKHRLYMNYVAIFFFLALDVDQVANSIIIEH